MDDAEMEGGGGRMLAYTLTRDALYYRLSFGLEKLFLIPQIWGVQFPVGRKLCSI